MTIRQTRQQRTAESRQRLLQAGLELLKERLVSPVEAVRSTDVAHRAGFTPGAFYHHWSSQDDYRVELREFVGGQPEIDSALDRIGAELAAQAENPIVALQLVCRNEIETQAQDPNWHIQLAMLASSHPADIAGSAQQYEQWSSELVAFYSGVFHALGLEFKPGFSMELFAATVSAMGEGFSLQQRAGITGVELDGPLTDWQPYETAVATLIASWMQHSNGRPVDDDNFLDQLRGLILDR